jgi:GT2 family glycosyltransferase
MIPTYNCAGFLGECLSSVLAEDPGPDVMQIEVVDDHSTDERTEAVVAELGKGRVGFHRQPRNMGHVANFNTCLQRSRGSLVHLLHGDDAVRHGFYDRMARLFGAHPTIGAAFCRHTIVTESGQAQRTSPLERHESGVLENWLERIASELPLQPPCVVVRRAVYERLGGFDRRMLSCGEDWEMWVRIATHYPVGYEPEPLAIYRDSSASLTKRHVRSGQNIRDVRRATQIVESYLPEGLGRVATRKARESWANWALYWAQHFIANGDGTAAGIQLREALRCSPSKRVVKAVLPMVPQLARLWLGRRP